MNSSFEFSSNGEVRLPLDRSPISLTESKPSLLPVAAVGNADSAPSRANQPAFDPKLVENALAKPVPKVPEHNKKVILAAVAAAGEGGKERVRTYHEKRFMAGFGECLGTLRQLAGDIRSNYNAVAGEEGRLSSIAERTPEYLEETNPGKPWTWPARLAVGFLMLFSCFMIVVGVNTNAVVLMNSGISGFEQPIRAYLFSMVAVGVAVGLKFLPRFFLKPEDRRVYAIWVWGLGLVLGVFFALFFSVTFPGMTTDPVALATSLAANNGSTPATGQGAWWLILAGMLAEAFLAAGCWLTVELIAGRYQSTTRATNPAHTKVMDDLTKVTASKVEIGDTLGHLDGRIEEIESQRDTYVEEAVALFDLAVELAIADQSRAKQIRDQFEKS